MVFKQQQAVTGGDRQARGIRWVSATVCALLSFVLSQVALSADTGQGSGWQPTWVCGQSLKPERKTVPQIMTVSCCLVCGGLKGRVRACQSKEVLHVKLCCWSAKAGTGALSVSINLSVFIQAVTVWTNGRDGFTCETVFAFIIAFPSCSGDVSQSFPASILTRTGWCCQGACIILWLAGRVLDEVAGRGDGLLSVRELTL